MQESRLFGIVYHLLDHGQATAPELAEKFEVSTRTIYRDIDALSGAGVPIYAESGRNGGIRLMQGFVLDQALLSEEEKQEILTAMQGLSATQSIQNHQTLKKLSAIFNVEAENWLEVDFSRWGNGQRDNQLFALLKSAVIARRVVTITYASSYGQTSRRNIYPFKLCYRSKAWYVKAYCTVKQAFRLFKLTRILDCQVTEEQFLDCPCPEEIEIPRETYGVVRLRFAKEAAHRVYDEFAPTQVETQGDGTLTVCARMPQDGWLVGFLLSFGAQVEVLSPAYLKDVLAQQAKWIYEKNSVR